jgi:hypothetical protein
VFTNARPGRKFVRTQQKARNLTTKAKTLALTLSSTHLHDHRSEWRCYRRGKPFHFSPPPPRSSRSSRRSNLMAISTRRCADPLDSTDKHCPRECLRDKICRMYCERWFDALQHRNRRRKRLAETRGLFHFSRIWRPNTAGCSTATIESAEESPSVPWRTSPSAGRSACPGLICNFPLARSPVSGESPRSSAMRYTKMSPCGLISISAPGLRSIC